MQSDCLIYAGLHDWIEAFSKKRKMFPKKAPTDINKKDFLHNVDEAREARRREKQIQQSVIIIQKTVRGYLVRKKYRNYRK